MRTEKVWITCREVKLYGELRIPGSIPAPAVVVCHGMDVQGFHFLKYYGKFAEKVCESGFVSLLFDFRGVGNSGGAFDYGSGEQRDVRCALDWLSSRKEVAANQIFLVGHSLGGAVSLGAVESDERVKGLVLWSVPKNHDYNVKKFISRSRGRRGLYAFLVLARLDRFVNVSRMFSLQVYGICLRPRWVLDKLMKLNETRDIIGLKGTPILIIVGNADPIVGVDEAEAIYQVAGEPKTLVVIDGADHNYRGKEDELISKTIEWLKNQRR